jgi:hypothetical protein
MKERIEIIKNNLYEEKLQLRKEIQELSWGMKYASLMTINGNEKKQELLAKLKQVQNEIDTLNWILEGDNNELC